MGITAALTIFIIVGFRYDCFVIEHQLLRKTTDLDQELAIELK